MGNAQGIVSILDERLEVLPSREGLEVGELPRAATIEAQSGKFSDSEDSFLFLYSKLDPSTTNFKVTATLRASGIGDGGDYQSGYGIVIADTDASDDIWCRHRNYAMAGCFGRSRTLGVQVVAGYTSPQAKDFDVMRTLDQSRTFDLVGSQPLAGEAITLTFAKDDEGLVATCGGESLRVPGCDFLTRQDESSVCVGFAAARNVRLEVEDWTFETSPGSMSHMPEDGLRSTIPDYPFPKGLIEDATSQDEGLRRNVVLRVSPDGSDGGDGSPERPLSLRAALRIAGRGTTILLARGTYVPDGPLVVPRGHDGTPFERIRLVAEHPREAVIEGSNLAPGEPLLVLAGDNWEVSGLVLTKSPLSGLTICGSGNHIRDCEAYGNADTGILIIAPVGVDPDLWPRDNFVRDCDSHDNCDPMRNNADGFGAKLRIGPGNTFYRCIAHHNVDDGFDLYSKSLFGPIGAVELDSCVAYENGTVSDADQLGRSSGFKLGGENQSVAHEVWNCLAFGNHRFGFSSNSNPACRLHYCTAQGNGEKRSCNFFFRTAREPEWVRECLYEPEENEGHVTVTRRADGSIDVHGQRTAERKDGNRLGADFRSKKILFLVSSLGGGGAERVGCRLATSLSERHRVWLVYLDRKTVTYPIGKKVTAICAAEPRWLKPLGGRLARFAKRAWKFVSKRVLLSYFSKLRGVDATVSMLITPNLLNARYGGRRKVMSERNDPAAKPVEYFERMRSSYAKADHVVFQTKKVAGLFEEETRGGHSIISNPVEVTCHASEQRTKRIVTVGRLNEQKNHPLLISAFAMFHESHPQHHLHIYGDEKNGGNREQLIGLAEELGISDFVHLEGFRTDIHEAIRDAEMFVLSSDFEGQSNALIEAMLMGIACISTACTGSDELIHDGVDGLLVPVGDAQALARAMCRLDGDPTLRASIERNAMQRAWEFSTENIVRKWERIL